MALLQTADNLSYAGDFNANTMVVDKETGFLVPGQGYTLEGFNLPKKIKFVELAKEMWPRIGLLCQAVGICRQTFTNHYKADLAFRKAVDEARDLALDEAEAAMRANSTAKGGFMDRIALLKAYRPERWNPERQLTLNHNVNLTREIAGEAMKSIPAEAYESPQGSV